MTFTNLNELDKSQLIGSFSSLLYSHSTTGGSGHDFERVLKITKVKADVMNQFIEQRLKKNDANHVIDLIELNPSDFFNSLFDFDSELQLNREIKELSNRFDFLNVKSRFDDEFIHPVDYINMGYMTTEQLEKYGSCYVCQRFLKNESNKGMCITSKKDIHLSKNVVFDCHQFKGQNINIGVQE